MRRSTFPLPITLFALACALGGTLAVEQADAQPKPLRPLRILVTNDDGWDSPGLAKLVEAFGGMGEIVVSAPLHNASGSGTSLGSLSGPFEVTKVNIPGAVEAYAVDATPATAALFGIVQLGAEHPFDFVVSGINVGANVGQAAHASGTVGAAMRAALSGIPALAVSQDFRSRDFSVAARYTAQLVRQLATETFPEGLVLSINVPAQATHGGAQAVIEPMGPTYLLLDGFRQVESKGEDDGDTKVWRGRRHLLTSPQGLEGTDTGSYLSGKITVTPITVDWTAGEATHWLESWLPQPLAESAKPEQAAKPKR